MRFLLALIVALALAVAAAWVFDRDSGVVMLSYEGWVLQTSVAVWLLATVLLALAAFLFFKVAGWLLGAGVSLSHWRQRHNERLAQRLLGEGLEKMAEGDVLEAERLLLKGASRAQRPLLHYLSAAQAADQRHDVADRDRYLEQARQVSSDSLAVLLTSTDVALREGRLEDARTKLERLQKMAPRQASVLRLRARWLQAREEWTGLIELLPRLRSRRVLSASECDAIEARAWQARLASAPREVAALARLVKKLPRRLQHDSAFALEEARALLQADAVSEAEAVLRKALSRHWSPALLAAYGELPVRPRLRALNQAEAWLKTHPEDPDLLACLARLCMQNSLWAPARKHLEAAIALRPEPRWLHWLADTLTALGEDTGAADASRRGLALAVGDSSGQSLVRL
jgi:HemY protein